MESSFNFFLKKSLNFFKIKSLLLKFKQMHPYIYIYFIKEKQKSVLVGTENMFKAFISYIDNLQEKQTICCRAKCGYKELR
jgi:hypothetical protein